MKKDSPLSPFSALKKIGAPHPLPHFSGVKKSLPTIWLPSAYFGKFCRLPNNCHQKLYNFQMFYEIFLSFEPTTIMFWAKYVSVSYSVSYKKACTSLSVLNLFETEF